MAGIGNIFFGDDGFGVETVQELLRGPIPADVRVEDFGIRGYDLASALVAGYDAAIFVDAIRRRQPPGTLCLLELDPPGPAGEGHAGFDGHSLDPVAALRLAATFGAPASRLYLVGCEPAVLETDNGEIGLSEPVAKPPCPRRSKWSAASCPSFPLPIPQNQTTPTGPDKAKEAHMNAWAIVGIVIGILALIVLVKMWPELRRYLHMRRM